MIMSTNYEYNTIRDELHTYAITIGKKNKQTLQKPRLWSRLESKLKLCPDQMWDIHKVILMIILIVNVFLNITFRVAYFL